MFLFAYCKYAKKYKFENKTVFWIMICKFLKQHTSYLFKKPKITIFYKVINYSNKFIKKK